MVGGGWLVVGGGVERGICIVLTYNIGFGKYFSKQHNDLLTNRVKC